MKEMVKHPKPEMGTEKEVTAHRVVAIILDTIIIGVILGFFTLIKIIGSLAAHMCFSA